MQYEIVFSTESIQDLTDKVNERISKLWNPQGGVTIVSQAIVPNSAEATLIYAQAMIKGSL